LRGLGTLGLTNKPDFLIIGAQKSGTSGLYSTLKKHPQIISSIKKEIHYFDNDAWFKKNNLKDYHSYFPLDLNHKKNIRYFEATPSYLYHPSVSERLWGYNKNLKLIVILREPSGRALSAYIMYHYHFSKGNRKNFFDKREFNDAISAEIFDLENGNAFTDYRGYVARGLYFEQLIRYYNYFPKNHILVLESEDLKKRPEINLEKVQNFLDIKKVQLTMEIKNKRQLDVQDQFKKELDFLKSYFQVHNEKLYDFLGINYNWD
jgi:hypothetical protein